MNVVASKVIAGCFGLCAFAVAILAGLASDNPASDILWRALVAMIVCYPIGAAVGLICDRVIIAHIQAHEAQNPVPDSERGESGDQSSVTSVGDKVVAA